MMTLLVSYSDSSWANAEGHASQHGALVLLAEPQVTDAQGPGCRIDFKSSRSSRVCRSLAAEASAADTSVDRAVFLNYLISEIIQNKPSFKLSILLRTIQVTDCRSLYDVLCSENPNTEEKRTIVTIRSMQQVLSRADVFWVPTIFQWADSLTKISWDLMKNFSEWLSQPWIKLHEWHPAKKERSVLILPGSHMQDVHVRFRLHLDQVRTELKDIEKLQQWPSLLCGNCVEQAFHQED